MPSYPSQKPSALYPGDQLALINDASVETGVTATISAAVGPAPANIQAHFVAFNGTNQSAVIQSAPADKDASYLALYNEGSAITVPAGDSVFFYCPGPWIRANFAVAPTSGSLILYRG